MNLLPSTGTADRWFLKHVYLNLPYELENTTYIEDTILTSAYKTVPEKKGKSKERIQEWEDVWMDGQMDIYGYIYTYMYMWMYGQMGGCMDG